MDAFKGKYQRTSADKYDEFLDVSYNYTFITTATLNLTLNVFIFVEARSWMVTEKGCYSLHPCDGDQ